MFSRRAFLSSTAAGAALALSPAPFAYAASTGAAENLHVLFESFFQEGLDRSPEGATRLGLDKGARAGARSKLNDRSVAAWEFDRAEPGQRLARLQTIDRHALTGLDAVNYDAVASLLETRKAIFRYDFGSDDSFSISPYVISQQTGVYQDIPDFLDNKHPIETASDADAYIARLEQFPAALDQDTERLAHDTAQGVVPCDFLLTTTLTQITALRATPPAQSEIVTSLASRMKKAGISSDHAAQAQKIMAGKVAPALDRQIAALNALKPKAVHDAGVWRFKDGDAYYAACLRSTTTTTMSPEDIHQLGLEQVAQIQKRLDPLLKAQGLTSGSVGARLTALVQDKRYLYPETDAGKAQMVEYMAGRIAAIRPRLPRAFRHIPTQKVVVRRVSPFLEAGAPFSYYNGPSLDGTRPGMVYINLHRAADFPRWTLATTAFHEGIPGHHLQISLAQSTPGIPMVLKVGGGFNAYIEGWALYAEQLADELGMYDDDPLGRIGYLKYQLFRAGRLVTDTGLHAKRWSREKAIAYLSGLDGDTQNFATREVERYAVLPGQACSYKIGHTIWNRLRDRAKKELGVRYDIRDFHDAGLLSGALPLDVLETVITGYIATRKA